MGYLVYIEQSTAQIKRKDFDKIRNLWIKMDENPPEEKYGGYGDRRWFSWMNEWRPKEDSVLSTLKQLGFSIDDDQSNDYITITRYDDKSGQEYLFFGAIKDYVTGSISWRGEDGDTYVWKFKTK